MVRSSLPPNTLFAGAQSLERFERIYGFMGRG
jgi:hypothetical protein